MRIPVRGDALRSWKGVMYPGVGGAAGTGRGDGCEASDTEDEGARAGGGE
jgi:hypothetical protein